MKPGRLTVHNILVAVLPILHRVKAPALIALNTQIAVALMGRTAAQQTRIARSTVAAVVHITVTAVTVTPTALHIQAHARRTILTVDIVIRTAQNTQAVALPITRMEVARTPIAQATQARATVTRQAVTAARTTGKLTSVMVS